MNTSPWVSRNLHKLLRRALHVIGAAACLTVAIASGRSRTIYLEHGLDALSAEQIETDLARR
jgi:hypothetical protein